MAWLDFEQDVEARSGHGCPAIYEAWQSDASRPERSCGTLGRNKRPYEKQAKADATLELPNLNRLVLLPGCLINPEVIFGLNDAIQD